MLNENVKRVTGIVLQPFDRLNLKDKGHDLFLHEKRMHFAARNRSK